ncbi:uncharacterized protein ARMOST_11380 [Armillaria ostoyae]|uniref:Uncharacterized protein n=1 Tax=Armillaria ostoyae TaxID=47428 RepID=A0A284RGZ9_ARMOS|nr:uncharacterized protein ARMOST_11380 [Armillaria ostoyae]
MKSHFGALGFGPYAVSRLPITVLYGYGAQPYNEIEEETYRQRPRPITPIWLERYRQYRSRQMERGLPGVSIATWMEYRARAGDRDPRRAGTRVQEYMAFQASAYTDRSDLEAFGGGSGMEASGSS